MSEVSLEILRDVKKQMENEIAELTAKRQVLLNSPPVDQELAQKREEADREISQKRQAWENERQLRDHEAEVRVSNLDSWEEVLKSREEAVSHLEEERARLVASQKLVEEQLEQAQKLATANSLLEESLKKSKEDLELAILESVTEKQKWIDAQVEASAKAKEAEALISDLRGQKQKMDAEAKDFSESEAKITAGLEEVAASKRELFELEASLNKRGEELNAIHQECLRKAQENQDGFQRLQEERFKLANEAALVAHQKGVL